MDFALDQTDLAAAYLTAPIEPEFEMFMEPPPGMTVKDGMGLRVCQALYDSMQGAQRLDVHKEKCLTSVGFQRSCAEPSLYFMPPTSKYGLVIVCTVVDDFLIACIDKYIQHIKNLLRRFWKLTDGGPVNWYLVPQHEIPT